MTRRNQCHPASVSVVKRLRTDGSGYNGQRIALVKETRSRYYGEVDENALAILVYVLNEAQGFIIHSTFSHAYLM
jgi:hypothetical protein